MEFELLGWSDEGTIIALDHQEFSYAGKFRMSASGKAVLREHGTILAAASFSADRSDEKNVWIRYLTVKTDRTGERLGSRLAATLQCWLLDKQYECVSIAVNNPFAYVACYRAGFAWTGNETGIAELVLSHTAPRSISAYQEGLNRFSDKRTLTDAELSYVEKWSKIGQPDRISVPNEWLPG